MREWEAQSLEVREWVANSDRPGVWWSSLWKAQWLIRRPRQWIPRVGVQRVEAERVGGQESVVPESGRLRMLEALSVGGLENGGQESGKPSEWEVKMVEYQ